MRLSKLGRAFSVLPRFAAACLEGRVPVSAMHAVAVAASNPRVGHYLDDDTDAMFTEWACTQDYDELVILLRHWSELADVDGARSRHDRARDRRHASLVTVGERVFLDATGPSAEGVLMREVWDHFVKAEWLTDWDAGVAEWGEQMIPSLMPRTAAQRGFDALHAVFRAAAGSEQVGGAVTVNYVVDQATFDHHLELACGGTPEPLHPSTAATRRCEDQRGTILDPRVVVAAALVGMMRRLVLDSAGVVLDMGRRQRLFTGALREAVLLSGRRCLWPGCNRAAHHCDADHTIPAAHGGPTAAWNGGPNCDHHNLWKNRGYRTWRDPQGIWHTYRPDGTEVGWRVQHVAIAA
jgi:hypothetical protein